MHSAVSLIDHLNPTPWATPLPDPTRAMLSTASNAGTKAFARSLSGGKIDGGGGSGGGGT